MFENLKVDFDGVKEMLDGLGVDLSPIAGLASRAKEFQDAFPFLFYHLAAHPEVAEKIPEIEARLLGVRRHLGVTRGGLVSGAPAPYLEAVLGRLRGESGWSASAPLRVVIFRGKYSRNALTAPWGTTYVGETLLRVLDSEAELAAILAHEVTHFEEAHGRLHPAIALDIAARYLELFKRTSGSRLLGELERMVDGFMEDRSHAHEYAADRGAIDRLAAAGYPIEAIEAALKKVGALSPKERKFRDNMKRYEYSEPRSRLRKQLLLQGAVYSTHPAEADRLEAARVYAGEIRLKALTAQKLLGWRGWAHGEYKANVLTVL